MRRREFIAGAAVSLATLYQDYERWCAANDAYPCSQDAFGYEFDRLREMLIGGTTRHVLERTTVPVLFAH